MNLFELENYLSKLKLHPDAYSIGIGLPEADETYCIVNEDGLWRIYYAERGQGSDMREYDSEDEACDAFIELLKSDESVWLR